MAKVPDDPPKWKSVIQEIAVKSVEAAIVAIATSGISGVIAKVHFLDLLWPTALLFLGITLWRMEKTILRAMRGHQPTQAEIARAESIRKTTESIRSLFECEPKVYSDDEINNWLAVCEGKLRGLGMLRKSQAMRQVADKATFYGKIVAVRNFLDGLIVEIESGKQQFSDELSPTIGDDE